jgi:hypothetical protein
MAKSIASLFGPSAEEIVYDRNQAEKIRQQAQLSQSLAGQETQAGRDFYRSGYNMTKGIGEGLAGLFGYSSQMEDPRIAKSLKLREALGSTDMSDLNDVDKLTALSEKLGNMGMLEEAMVFSDRAVSLSSAAYDRGYKERELAAKTGSRKPIPKMKALNEDGSYSPVEQRGPDTNPSFFNSDTGEEIIDFTKIKDISAIDKGAAKEQSAAERFRLRNAYLKDYDFDPSDEVSVTQEIVTRRAKIMSENKELTLTQAEQLAWQQMVNNGVVEKGGFLSDAKFNPGNESSNISMQAVPGVSIERQQADRNLGGPGLKETWNQGKTETQYRELNGKLYELLVDVDGNIVYDREIPR